MSEMPIKSGAPTDEIRVRTIDDLDRITHLGDEIKILIDDLLLLMNSLYLWDADLNIIEIKDKNRLQRIQKILVGRITEMREVQKSMYQTLIQTLSRFT